MNDPVVAHCARARGHGGLHGARKGLLEAYLRQWGIKKECGFGLLASEVAYLEVFHHAKPVRMGRLID